MSDVIVWHGVYFVKQGMYQGGVFKFVVEFPPLYPSVRPSVRFLTSVYHPLVHPTTLEVNLDVSSVSLLNILGRVQRMDSREALGSERPSIHQETVPRRDHVQPINDRAPLQRSLGVLSQFLPRLPAHVQALSGPVARPQVQQPPLEPPQALRARAGSRPRARQDQRDLRARRLRFL